MTTPESRVALVTGSAGDGPGQSIARSLAAAGYDVVLVDMNKKRLDRVTGAMRADYPQSRINGYVLDVGDREQIKTVFADVTAQHGPLRALVNDAGHSAEFGRTAMFDCTFDEWDRSLAVNLSGPWALARLAMPHMRDAGGGVIVNIGTYAADIGYEGAYAIGKGALNVLTRVCAREGGPFGIRAVTVTTGYIRDSFFARAHPEMRDNPVTRPLLPDHATAAEVGAAVAFLVSDAAAHITGETLNIAAGAYMRV